MDIKKILVPTDFSDSSQSALEKATSLARDTGAMLLIVHVKQPSDAHGDDGIDWDADTVALSKMLDQARPTDPGVGFSQRLLSGDPAEEIVKFAEQEGVDLIVVGTHGRTGLMRMLMGSIAEAVVRTASCPVLAVKSSTPAAGETSDLETVSQSKGDRDE